MSSKPVTRGVGQQRTEGDGTIVNVFHNDGSVTTNGVRKPGAKNPPTGDPNTRVIVGIAVQEAKAGSRVINYF